MSLYPAGAEVVCLRRHETSIPWGFRMQGGNDFGTCLFIQKSVYFGYYGFPHDPLIVLPKKEKKVTPRSIAGKCGLKPGDGILRIGHTPAIHLNHDQAKMEIIRAGNEIDILIQRGAVDVSSSEVVANEPDNKVQEEPSEYKGYTDPQVQSRSFKILQRTLTPEASQ